MTVNQLKEYLENIDGNLPVVVAYNGNHPISNVDETVGVAHIISDDPDVKSKVTIICEESY